MIMSVIRDIASQPRLSDAVDVLIRRAAKILTCERVTMFHVHTGRRELTVAASGGGNADSAQHADMHAIRIPLDASSLAGAAAVVRRGRTAHQSVAL